MATENDSNTAPGRGNRKAILPVLVGVALGVLIGAPTGALVGAPMAARKMAGAVPGAAAAHATKAAAHADAAEDHADDAVYLLDDVVINPANTDGSRYLIAKVALQGRGEKFSEEMKGRDAEVRDVVGRLLGGKTVPELADVNRRDSIKAELLKQLVTRFPREGVRTVYFPQFVIQ